MFTKTFSLKSTLAPRRFYSGHPTGPQWTRFLRFLDETGKVVWGEPIDATFRTAKLISDGIVTETIVEVTSV
jgi:hypothetical protein